MIESKIPAFLSSKSGSVWFESAISSYIFPRDLANKTDYTEKKGLGLIEDEEVLELDKAVKEALKINISDIVKFQKEFFTNTPLFWLESDTDGNELIEVLKSSKLYKQF